MSQETDADRGRQSRRQVAPLWLPLLFGLLSLFNMVGKPSFATIRGVDVVQLIATGMCFGVALATLAVFVRRPRAR